MTSPADTGVCPLCTMNPKLTHTAAEHQVAVELQPKFMAHIKTDAFSGGDRPMTYAQAIKRFELATSARRFGRVMDVVEQRLITDGWPDPSRAGVMAYVLDSSGKPGGTWIAQWKMRPEDARRQARAYLRYLTLDVDVDL